MTFAVSFTGNQMSKGNVGFTDRNVTSVAGITVLISFNMANNISGKNLDPVGSDEHHDPYCEVCEETKGRNVKIFGFCKECNQFLCPACNVFHSKLQGTKGHKVDTGDDMPKSMSEKQSRFDLCDDHPKEPKDQFCFGHKLLLCLLCSKAEHSKCLVKPVHEVCRNISTSELDGLCNRLSALETSLKSVLPVLAENKDNLEVQKKKMMEKAKYIYEKTVTKAERIYEEMK